MRNKYIYFLTLPTSFLCDAFFTFKTPVAFSPQESDSENEDSEETSEKIRFDEAIVQGESFMKFMEQEFFSQEEVMNMYHYIEKAVKEKAGRIKQVTLHHMLARRSKGTPDLTTNPSPTSDLDAELYASSSSPSPSPAPTTDKLRDLLVPIDDSVSSLESPL